MYKVMGAAGSVEADVRIYAAMVVPVAVEPVAGVVVNPVKALAGLLEDLSKTNFNFK